MQKAGLEGLASCPPHVSGQEEAGNTSSLRQRGPDAEDPMEIRKNFWKQGLFKNKAASLLL